MKILMIAPQPFFEPRGTPISVYQRLHGLSKLGHSIDLVIYHIGRDVDLPGVRIYRIPKVPFIKSLRVGPSWQKLPLDLLLFVRAFILLIGNRYDVIHSHEEAAFFSVLLSWLFHTKHLYDMHSSLPKQLVNFKFADNQLTIGLFRFFERLVIRTCDGLITIGPDLQELARQIDPLVPEKMIENLPLGGDNFDPESAGTLRREQNLDGRVVVVYTGTFERYQGMNLLVESAAALKDKYPEAIYILVGGNSEQTRVLKALAMDLGISDLIRLTGTISVEEANRYLAVADILVSPRTEGTSVPLKLYTYLRAGKPILATKLIAHTLVLDSNTALLVEPTREGLAEGLAKLIKDGDLRGRLGQGALRLAEEKYTEASYLARLNEIYQSIWPSAAPVGNQVKHSEG
jgi:glycosyltransferase involved in cell wall biosynthesis